MRLALPPQVYDATSSVLDLPDHVARDSSCVFGWGQSADEVNASQLEQTSELVRKHFAAEAAASLRPHHKERS